VAVSKEAIMAAGAIFTPQILQVSGIGDAAYLSSINVSSVVDLPAVGENFQDHPMVFVINSSTYFLPPPNFISVWERRHRGGPH
jgi:choline dehydrogenase-like flavoprotein